MMTRRMFALTVLTVIGSACEGFLATNDPDVITVEDLSGESAIEALYAGAHGAYARMLYFAIVDGGTFTDEFIHSGRHSWREEYDRRMSLGGEFGQLQEQRAFLEFASDEIRRISTSSDVEPRLVITNALTALAYITFAEMYCSGVPFGRLRQTGAPEQGIPKTTDETLQTAIAWLNSENMSANSDESAAYLTAVARARALLNQGLLPEAADAVSVVPDDFSYGIEHTTSLTNDVFFFTHQLLEISVANNEGMNGLPFRTAADPRVPFDDRVETGADGTTRHYRQLTYPTRDA